MTPTTLQDKCPCYPLPCLCKDKLHSNSFKDTANHAHIRQKDDSCSVCGVIFNFRSK